MMGSAEIPNGVAEITTSPPPLPTGITMTAGIPLQTASTVALVGSDEIVQSSNELGSRSTPSRVLTVEPAGIVMHSSLNRRPNKSKDA